MEKRNIFLSFIVILGLLAGFHLSQEGRLQALLFQGRENQELEETMITEPRTSLVTVAAVGDIMMHSPQINAGYQQSTGEYNFDHFFKEIKPYLISADLTLGNLEVPLAGKDRQYTGYPRFNSPSELAAALKNSGFDLVTTANNHALDRGEAGVLATLDNLDKYGLKYVGTARNDEEKNRIFLEEIKGIKIAVLAYTYGTNGIPIPKDKPYLINLIDENLIQNDVRKAKELKADFIIACIHWGNEYQRQPNDFQKELAAKVIGYGVDVIIGSHPHVLQPAEKIFVNSEEGIREGLVIYSMGNFISNQKERYRDSSIVLILEIEKDWQANQTVLRNAVYIPTWVQRLAHGKPVYRVLPVEKAIKDYEQRKDQSLSSSDYQKLKQAWEDITGLLGEDDLIKLKTVIQ
ncbi:MAG TPA: CapA family protein [Clostridia bacterium]|nr:CapA family protein [Clostridia bacterium]